MMQSSKLPNLEPEVGSWDSVLLEHLSEDNFISNLQQRYKRDHIYTYIGTYLLALNPYKPLPLYTPDLVQLYATKSLFHLPPHIFSFTNKIFQTLQDYNEDQCIVLSGESGAGKTETSRLILHFLTQIADIKRKIQFQKANKHSRATRRRSSNSLSNLVKSTKSNSCTSTPKRCPTVVAASTSTLPMPEKSGCLRIDKSRRRSHEKTVEFDFSHHKSTESLSRQSLKQSTSTSNVYSRSFDEKDLYTTAAGATATTTCTKICPKHNAAAAATTTRYCDLDNIQYVKMTNMKQASGGGSTTKLHCCSEIRPEHPSTSATASASAYYYAIPKSHHKCNCHEQLQQQQLLLNQSTLSRSILKSSSTHLDILTAAPSSACCNTFQNLKSSLNDCSIDSAKSFIAQHSGRCHDLPLMASPKLSRSVYKDSRSTVYSIDEFDVGKMKERVAQAVIFLEALGNATTIQNVNSSRFGKYYDVEVDFKGDTVGGHITHYMLEKSRITSRNSGERNFHIFYQLLSGADIHFLKTLKLQRNIDRYELLRNSCSSDDDKNSFVFTRKALDTIGLAQEEISAIFKIVAVVLKLGNLQFVPTTNIDGTEGCGISNDYELQEIAQLLNLDESILLNCLIKSGPIWNQLELDTGSELDALKASRIRYILCRTLYGRLFTWVVNRINESLKFKHYSRGKNIGILDFYGFEILDKNAFEQLAINYCNEKFHQFFLQNVLKLQQDLYVGEGLEWTKIDYFDNTTICDLIDKPNFGILSLLDEPRVTCDSTLATRLQQCCAGHTNFELQSVGSVQLTKCFQIRHYAGPVSYTVNGFIETNKDFLPKYISAGLYQSNLSIVQILFPEGNPKRQSKKPTSLGANLRTSLQTLLSIIANRQLNYVFCIKPNDKQQQKLFDLSSVQHQVRYMSLMPLVHLWRTGYYFNLSHKSFLNRYKLVSPLTWPHYHKGTIVEGIALIIRSVPLPAAEFTIGGKRVFIRSPRTVYELEEIRRSRLDCLATMIQKNVRAYFARRHFLKMKQSQMIIASAWRTWRECRFGIPYTGRRHMSGLYRAAREQYRIAKYQRQVEWAVGVIQRFNMQWKRRQYLLTLLLRLPANSMSPLSLDWVTAPRFLTETSQLLRNIYHKWRCYKYRKRFDQTARNRMREKVTASIIFKDRKISYTKSVSHPFLGDYVRLRQNVQWKKICVESNDQYVVFADIVNKITRSSGKYVPILLVLSTSSMLLLDQRTLQVKYRIPASEIYRMSLSPYLDDIAVFHVKADNHPYNEYSDGDTDSLSPSGCLFQSEYGKKKGDFVFQTGHVIEIVTKLFLVVQNATSKPPDVHISTDFEANFGQQTVIFTFKCGGMNDCQTRVTRKGNRMEVTV